MNLIDKTWNYLKEHRREILIVFALFILAFAIRAHLFKYELFFEFDSYFHARMTGYAIQGQIPDRDPLAYYQLGGGNIPNTSFFWNFNAFWYKLLFLGAPYNKDLLIWLVKFLPAFYGALTVVAMYFLGREIYNRRTGIVMAFFAAIVPAFVYRTMGGFLEEDALGFLWLVIGFVFLIKAVKNPELKKANIIFSLLAGIFFGIMALTWEMYLVIPIIISAYFIFGVLNFYAKRSIKELLDFVKLFLITFIVFGIIASFYRGTGWINTITSNIAKSIPPGLFFPVMIVVFLGAAILLFLVFLYHKKDYTKMQNQINFLAMALQYLILIVILWYFIFIPDIRFSEAGALFAATVGEESLGNRFFGEKYNAMILLPLIALVILPFRIFKKKDEQYSNLFFFWIVLTLVMAWYKLKFTFTFGLPVAVGAGVIFNEGINFLSKRNLTNKRVLAVLLGLFLFIGIASGSFFMTRNVPNIESPPYWKQAFQWINTNLPNEEIRFFNWWNNGHWISFVTEKKVLLDNRNLDVNSDRDFSIFLISRDEQQALDILKSKKSTHVIIEEDDLFSIGSYVFYAFEGNPGNEASKYVSPIPSTSFDCSSALNPTNSLVEYSCGGNRFEENQFNSFPTTWIDKPNNVQQFNINGQNVVIPLFVYRKSDNTKLYIINPTMNNTTLVKLLTHKKMPFEYKEIYSNPGLRIIELS